MRELSKNRVANTDFVERTNPPQQTHTRTVNQSEFDNTKSLAHKEEVEVVEGAVAANCVGMRQSVIVIIVRTAINFPVRR